MHAYNITLQDACTYLGQEYANLVRNYLDAKSRLQLQSFGDERLKADIMRYVEGMEFWPIGNIVRTWFIVLITLRSYARCRTGVSRRCGTSRTQRRSSAPGASC